MNGMLRRIRMMALRSKYSKYKSYDYLADARCQKIRLSKQADRVEPYLVSLTSAQEERLKGIVDGRSK